MEVTRACISCGGNNVVVDKLEMGDYENWFVKCNSCMGVMTVTHAVRDEAIKQWDSAWGWQEIDKLSKRAKEAELKEASTRFQHVEDARILQFRYEKLADEYIKYRMLYSGTAGNINLEERKNLMKKELSAELGFKIP